MIRDTVLVKDTGTLLNSAIFRQPCMFAVHSRMQRLFSKVRCPSPPPPGTKQPIGTRQCGARVTAFLKESQPSFKNQSQILIECQEKLPKCWTSKTVEPITSRGGECSNTGGIQEKLRQPSGRYPLIYIPALSRGLDLMALYTSSNFTIL